MGSAFVAKYLANAPGPLNPPWVPVTYAPFAVPSEGKGIAVDGQGNVYVTGDLLVGPGLSKAMVFSVSAGGPASYVYTSPTPGLDSGTAIDLDSVGNCYVTGYLHSVLFTNTWDLWVAKFTPALAVGPSQRWYSPDGLTFAGEGIRVDTNGAPYMAGFFGSSAAMMRLTPAFGAPAFGTFPSPVNTWGPDIAWALALDNPPPGAPQGVYLTGSFCYLAPNNGPNLFVAKLLSTWP
jgi:hypothetical protein